MNIHPFGKTNLLVTPLGVGLAALGRPGYINLGHADDLKHNYEVAAMEEHAYQVLDAAWEGGIRYFDAARSYGRAEVFLGNWLRARHIKPTDVAVGSKWGYTYTAGWKVEAEHHEIKEHSLAVLQRQWGESQENLSPYLRLYQVHSATLQSGIFESQEVHRKLIALKEAGTLIGASLSGPTQAETVCRAMEIEIAGRQLFDSIQATWNLLEPSAGPALQSAHQAGIGIIVKEALANGRLLERNQDPEFAPQLARLQEQAQRLGTTLDALGLAAVLAQPWVDIVLSGATTPQQLISNLGGLQVSWDEEAAQALACLAEPPQVYWQRRSGLQWN